MPVRLHRPTRLETRLDTPPRIVEISGKTVVGVLRPPPAPLSFESPWKRKGTLAALAAAGLLIAVVGADLLRRSQVVPASVAVPPSIEREVTVLRGGEVLFAAAPGTRVAEGDVIVRIARAPAGDAAEADRLRRVLDREERLLTDARREQSRIDVLFRDERATRSERDDASRLVSKRLRRRDDAKRLWENARIAASPTEEIVLAPVAGILVELRTASGERVADGRVVAILASP